MNLCPAIVDAVKDKLIVTGFSVEDAGAVGSRQSAVGRRRSEVRTVSFRFDFTNKTLNSRRDDGVIVESGELRDDPLVL